MRESSSKHTYPISLARNTATGYLLPSCDEVDFPRLAECLQLGTFSEHLDSDSEFTFEPKSAGSKKRVARGGLNGKGKGKGRTSGCASTGSTASGSSAHPAKRIKLEDGDITNIGLDESLVSVIRHTFEIEFTVDETESTTKKSQAKASVSAERDFLSAVQAKIAEQDEDEDGPIIVDLCTIYPHALDGDALACTEDPLASGRKAPLPLTRLLTLPALMDDKNDAHFDFNKAHFKNILVSAYHLQMHKRARVAGSLQLVIPSRFSIDPGTRAVLVSLRIVVTVWLNESGIFEPLYTYSKKLQEEEEAQRRVLIYAFGQGYAKPANYRGTDVPFFLSCLHPAPSLASAEANEQAQPRDLLPTLLPFQRRSVGWMLSREMKQLEASGGIVDTSALERPELPLFWEKVQLVEGKDWYFNPITGRLLAEYPPADELEGGILAEEPGLGKTLESIALIMLNTGIGRNPSISRYDPVGVMDVKEIKTTLIVTPSSLAQQWVDELTLHAPSLKVHVYEGWTKVPVPITAREAEEKTLRLFRERRRPKTDKELGPRDIIDDGDAGEFGFTEAEREEFNAAGKQMTWCDFAQQFDVVITTYNTLQQDLGVARAPLVRPRREVAKYADIYRDRSPLVMAEWNRVIMDEVQMVGGGKTEEMVSLIPRLSSFAVSGTPARAAVDDLVHVVNFLRVNAITQYPKAWTRLLKVGFAAHFQQLFGRIAVRTMKAKVQNELTIPQQRRYVVPVELGKVEKHVYDQHIEQALADLGFDERGVATSSGWQVDVTLLRTWIRKLRAVCTHPQVGQLAKHNDRLSKAGQALKSIAEVLENMRDQNWRALMDDRKSKVQKRIAQAQYIQHVEENLNRYNEALELLLDALKAMDVIILEIDEAIKDHNAKGELLKQQGIAQRGREQAESSAGTEDDKQKRLAVSEVFLDDSEDASLPKTQQLEERRIRKKALSQRLRDNRIVLHQIHFLLGDVYHILGEEHSVKEDEAYGAAEMLRKQLLKLNEEAANLSIAQLKASSVRASISGVDMKIEHCGEDGEQSKDLLLEANRIIDVLNQQTDLIFEWRARITKLLTESLSASDGENADGEEYARTLETQGEAEAYLQAYAALLADRREILVAERTALATYDAREKKFRKTYAAAKAQQPAAGGETAQTFGDDEMAPEHEVLQDELAEKRKNVRKGVSGRAVKSISVDLHGVATSISDNQDPERIIANEWSNKLKALIREQSTLHDDLESDTAQFRKAFNDRIEYFRQLQELSDSVRPAEWEGAAANALVQARTEEEIIKKRINKHQARRRYLKNLVDGEEEEEEDKMCVLCRSEFTRGFMTQCAHIFCENCLKMWASRPEGKACPVCRVILVPDQLQRVTMKSNAEVKVESQSRPKEAVPQSRRVIEYNTIEKSVFEEIQKIDCLGSYGTKIETLVRHLLYLEDIEPGCKSIVFSAWADSLYILERALLENGIKCLRIDQRKGKQNAAKAFKMDDSIRVLLLHGERENAGLNVTCASRVFLTESVVQHLFELQAIARIDRMGQTRPTEVFCYYAENTVEKNILDLAAKQGLSLYTKDHAVGTLQVTSFDMDDAGQANPSAGNKSNKKQKGQKGDFILKTDDMLAVLFPHLFEDAEYLLPESEAMNATSFDLDEAVHEAEDMRLDYDMAPVAGPSRLS